MKDRSNDSGVVGDADAMRRSWNARAKDDPLYAIDARRRGGSIDEFYAEGLRLVEEYVDPGLDILAVDPSALRVLDIGCGMGRLFEGLSHRFHEVWGIDISQEMIELGKADCPVEATWFVGDGISLRPIADQSVDHVVSFEVFEHIPRRSIIESYFKEITRVLRPYGTFQVQLRGGSDSRRQAVVRSLPRPFRVVSGSVLRGLGIMPVQGDIDTWLGCITPPDSALTMMRTMGYTDYALLGSRMRETPGDGPRYWAIGRKPRA
jgi:SAM-dependent methyltransferase